MIAPDPPGTAAAFAAPASLDYRRPAVRDLAWLVLDGAMRLPSGAGSPATVSLDQAERAEFVGLLQRWDLDPLDGWLGVVDPRLRLGLYTERLIGAWLRQSRRIRLVAMNWPLRARGVTLGEADFLVQRQGSPGSELQLWELACKFYLGVPGWGWIGPELHDSLAAKLGRMRSHQLQLIHQAGFQSEWGSNWSARAWLAGWLLEPAATLFDRSRGDPSPADILPADPSPADFSPAGPSSADPSPTAACHEQTRHGLRVPAVWAEIGDGSVAAAQSHACGLGIRQWWLLPKRRWLRPVFADQPVAQQFADLYEAARFEAVASASRRTGGESSRPLMLAGIRWMQNASHPAVAIEAMRVMLVPRGWTGRAAAIPKETAKGGGAAPPGVNG